MKIDNLTKLTCLFGLLFIIGSIAMVLGGNEKTFKLDNGGVYIKDDVCMLNSTNVRSEKEMRADDEQCVRIRKSLKKE